MEDAIRALPAAAAEHSGEQSLVAQAARDEAAFAELYRRYLRRVYRYLLTYTDNPDDAADLAQLVFLRVLEALPNYRDRGLPFAAWLFRIARNVATDTYRRRQRSIPWEHVPEAWLPFGEGDPESAAVRREALNRLRLLVSQLAPPKQELLYLRFAGRLTAREIGAVVGKSEAAVQRELNRTIHHLRERYDAT